MGGANQKAVDEMLERYNQVSEIGGRTKLNLNLELSKLLLDVPIKRRPLKVETCFRELIEVKNSGA